MEYLEPHIGTIIGAVIGFFSSIGFFLISRWIDRRGRIRVFCKRTAVSDATWGFTQSEIGEAMLFLPLTMELYNTSNATRVTRNIQLLTYKDGKKVDSIRQISMSAKAGHVTDYGAENASYSFVLPPRTIKNVRCLFISSTNVVQESFDEFRIAYYDEKDKEINLHLAFYDGNWICRNEQIDGEWIELGESLIYPLRVMHKISPKFHPKLTLLK